MPTVCQTVLNTGVTKSVFGLPELTCKEKEQKRNSPIHEIQLQIMEMTLRQLKGKRLKQMCICSARGTLKCWHQVQTEG